MVFLCGRDGGGLEEEISRGKRGLFVTFTRVFRWLRGPAVERRSLAGVLSLSCARPVAEYSSFPFPFSS